MDVKTMAKMGGDRTKELYGLSHYSRIGKLGGRPRKKLPLDKSNKKVYSKVNEK